MGNFIHTDRKIIICDKCEGSGECSWKETTSQRIGNFKIKYKTCNKCKGTGRLLEIKKWETVYEPYESQKYVNKNLRRKLSDEKK